MKKLVIIGLLFLILFFNLYISPVKADSTLELTKDAKSAILIEPTTMTVIYEKNAKEALSPASMTKIMTLILIMESLEKGQITLDEKVQASMRARKITGSKIYLEYQEEMSVDDLLKGIAIGSGNDAAIAMAEKIGGSEENFVNMMNQKAKELGAVNTNFKNCHGLDEEGHYSCAYDIALFGAYLVNTFGEKILRYTSVYEDYLRKETPKPFWLVNTNKLVRFVEGVDGLKSGWTDIAGYCLCATIHRGNIRFISVVMGCSTNNARNQETMQMLNYGLSNFELINIFKKNQPLRKYKDITLGNIEYNIVPSKDINVLVRKGAPKKDVRYDMTIDYQKIKQLENKNIGTLKVYYDNKLISTVSLDIVEEVKKASFIDCILAVFKEVFLVSK